MKQNIALALLLSSPLLADSCCQPLMENNCYPYAVNPTLTFTECYGFGGNIDFLYWKPSVENNAFANVVVVNVDADQTSVQPKDFANDWDYGFRIGIEGVLPCNDWKIGLNWTDFRTNTTRNISSGADSFIQLTNSNSNLASLYSMIDSSARASYKLELDVVNLLFKREFYVGHAVTLQPYAGLTYLSLKQKGNVSSVSNAISLEVQGIITSHEELVTDFQGGGIVGGFTTTWEALCNFGLYGDVSTSILYGRSKSHLSASTAVAIAPPFTSNVDWQYNVDAIKASLDLALGIQWRYLFCADSQLLTIRAGWEEHIFFRQNTFPRLNLPVTNATITDFQPLGDISFQGLVVSLSYSY